MGKVNLKEEKAENGKDVCNLPIISSLRRKDNRRLWGRKQQEPLVRVGRYRTEIECESVHGYGTTYHKRKFYQFPKACIGRNGGSAGRGFLVRMTGQTLYFVSVDVDGENRMGTGIFCK